MSVFKRLLRVKQAAPPGIEIVRKRAEEFFGLPPGANKYEWFKQILYRDAEVFGCVHKLALMVQRSYQGIVGDDEEIVQIARRLAEKLSFRDLFYTVAKHLLTYGDDIYKIYTSHDGVTLLQPLPIQYLTILESEDQIQQYDAQIFEANLYVLNELNDEKRKTFGSDEILHFSIDRIAEEVRDILGRYTFGVWSISPLEPLRTVVMWKHEILLTDILWRSRNVPREHHKLDLSMFEPTAFPGATADERLTKARESAKGVLKDYAERIIERRPDQAYVTDKGVEIDVVEPRTARYMSPDPLLDQLNRSIFATIGPPESAVYGRGRATFASELVVSSYATLTATSLAERIRKPLKDLLIRHLSILGYDYDRIQQADIKLQLVLDIDRGEMIRQAAVLRAMGIMTPNELRRWLGYDPLPPEVLKELQLPSRRGRGAESYTQTIEDIERSFILRTEPRPEPITPESRRQKQVT